MIEAYDLALWMHVGIMGYWIGSDLVINALTHYFKNARSLPVAERMKLWDFLLLVDQHPRNAIILSIPLGFTLAAGLQLSPIKGEWLSILWAASIAWFIYMWVLHFQVGKPAHRLLNNIDIGIRYALMVVLFLTGLTSLILGEPYGARWLGAKVMLFSLLFVCEIGIRHHITRVYAVFPSFKENGSTPEFEAVVTDALNKATYILAALFINLIVIGYLGAAKPF